MKTLEVVRNACDQVNSSSCIVGKHLQGSSTLVGAKSKPASSQDIFAYGIKFVHLSDIQIKSDFFFSFFFLHSSSLTT